MGFVIALVLVVCSSFWPWMLLKMALWGSEDLNLEGGITGGFYRHRGQRFLLWAARHRAADDVSRSFTFGIICSGHDDGVQ